MIQSVKILFAIAITGWLFGCSNSSKSGSEEKEGRKISLDYFQSIPDTIDGCSELYTYDTTDYKTRRYIFVSNVSEFGIIQIDGKLIYLKVIPDESKETSNDEFVSVFANDNYKVVLKTKKLTSSDEVSFNKGELRITRKKTDVVFKVHGESGC